MLNSFDYSYYSEESIIHRLNPVVKIVGLIVYVFLCLLKFNNLLFIISTCFIFLLLLLSNIRMIKYLKTVWKLKYLIIVLYIMMIHHNMALFDINVIVFKLVFVVLYIRMMLFTTSKIDLGKGFAIVVDMFNLIGFSLKKITMFFINIFIYPAVFIETYIEIFTNLEIKGEDYTHTNLIVKYKLFFKNIRMVFNITNDKMKLRKMCMKYRFYKSSVKSQYKYRNKLCIFDYIFIIVNIGLLVFYILKVRI